MAGGKGTRLEPLTKVLPKPLLPIKEKPVIEHIIEHFIAFGIKAAFPYLNGWLQDSYPEASEAGTVALSAFTTKLAIYALARSFAGVEILIYIGA